MMRGEEGHDEEQQSQCEPSKIVLCDTACVCPSQLLIQVNLPHTLYDWCQLIDQLPTVSMAAG
jgi:hypothetical protein